MRLAQELRLLAEQVIPEYEAGFTPTRLPHLVAAAKRAAQILKTLDLMTSDGRDMSINTQRLLAVLDEK